MTTYELKMDTNPIDGDKLEEGTEVKLQKIDFGTMAKMQEKTKEFVKKHGELGEGEIPASVSIDLIQRCVEEPEELKKKKYIEKLSYPDMKGITEKLSEISGIKKKEMKK